MAIVNVRVTARLLAVVAGLSASVAHAQTPQHTSTTGTSSRGGVVGIGNAHAAEMSDEEHISARLGVTPHAQTDGHGYSEGIDGRTHPEAFLPFELFDYLLDGVSADARHREGSRAIFDPQLPAYGYDAGTFWTQLASVSQSYIAARDKAKQEKHRAALFTLPGGRKALVPVSRDVCSARIEALAMARTRFGRKNFDRFLYRVVAPNVMHSEGGSSSDRAAQLRFMAGGCR